MQTTRIHYSLIVATAAACLLVSSIFPSAMADTNAAASTNLSHDPPVSKYMWRRYHNTSGTCPTYSKASADYNQKASTYPAVACTGILMRFTSPASEKNGGWIPEDKSVSSNYISVGGISFTYIRADAKFIAAPWNDANGFTLYPAEGKYGAPVGKQKPVVLCAYPRDGGTDDRADAGCAPPCDQPSSTYWYQSYLRGGMVGQCSFDLRDSATSAANFQQFMRSLLPTTMPTLAGTQWDELRLKTWGQDDQSSKELALESFFYMHGNATALANAQLDQQQYYALTQQFVPIIEITPPASIHDDYQFVFHSANQKVPIPLFEPPLPCTPGDFDPSDLKC